MASQVSARRFDLSRDTFDETNLYRSIVKQQGRVTVDADDNEQRRIELHRSNLTTLDVIGPCGYPAGGTGFQIGVDPTGKLLTVGTGRMYVGGLMCESFETTQTLMLDSGTAGNPPAVLPVSSGGYTGLAPDTYLAYLDVWEKDVTAIDDPNIRETALGGPDTAARTQLVAQVHLVVEASGATCATATLPANPDHLGTLTASTDPSAAAQDCTLPPLAGYRGQENQLYRVEIHTGGPVGTATFKWSRENGSVVTAITGATSGTVGGTFTVQSLGADSTLGFAANDWVELIDDTLVNTGQTGQLALIQPPDATSNTITLTPSSPVNVISYGDNPKIRRWDQTDATAWQGIVTSSTPIQLENGVQVAFGGSTFYPGDYWLIPARTAIDEETGTLDFPTTPQYPQYVVHRQCKLAVIGYDTSSGWGTPSDCRISFPPLTGLPEMGGGCCTTVTVVASGAGLGEYTDIGAAIAALPAAGGVVGIEAGNYTIASPIEVPANVTLRGCGAATVITALDGAFVVIGDAVTIEHLTFVLESAPAVATLPEAEVDELIVRGNAVTTDDQATVTYAFSFSCDSATICDNDLVGCGIEVQPESFSVVIRRNTILEAAERGISLGTQEGAAQPPGQIVYVQQDAQVNFADKDVNLSSAPQSKTYTFGVKAEEIQSPSTFTGLYEYKPAEEFNLASVREVTIEQNVIDFAAAEGIGATLTAGVAELAGTVNASLILITDVTIADNQIVRCLSEARSEKGAAAIALPVVERLSVLRNLVYDNGREGPVSGIGVLFGSGIEIRQNRIQGNGSGATDDDLFGLAAIELLVVFSGTTTGLDAGLPAAIVADNVVSSTKAAALFVMADGQVNVTGNDFSVTGVGANALSVGRCVTVMDFGSGAQEMVSAVGVAGALYFKDDQAPNYSTDAEVTGGQVMFCENRCLLDARDTGKTVPASIALVSTDAVLAQDNQSRAFALASSTNGKAGIIVANMLVDGLVAQVSGNRLSEDLAYASAMVVGGDTLGIGNHGTHCLLFQAAGTRVDNPNIVNPLNAPICKRLGTVLDDAAAGK
jgi:hypothetical protein